MATAKNRAIEDDAVFPPDPATMPYAAELDQWAKQIAAFGKVVPSLVISVEITAGAPSVAAVSSPRTSVRAPHFTVVRR
ncbi:hypothetical protein WMF38_46750 [Sorangium sp. So ce118]